VPRSMTIQRRIRSSTPGSAATITPSKVPTLDQTVPLYGTIIPAGESRTGALACQGGVGNLLLTESDPVWHHSEHVFQKSGEMDSVSREA